MQRMKVDFSNQIDLPGGGRGTGGGPGFRTRGGPTVKNVMRKANDNYTVFTPKIKGSVKPVMKPAAPVSLPLREIVSDFQRYWFSGRAASTDAYDAAKTYVIPGWTRACSMSWKGNLCYGGTMTWNRVPGFGLPFACGSVAWRCANFGIAAPITSIPSAPATFGVLELGLWSSSLNTSMEQVWTCPSPGSFPVNYTTAKRAAMPLERLDPLPQVSQGLSRAFAPARAGMEAPNPFARLNEDGRYASRPYAMPAELLVWGPGRATGPAARSRPVTRTVHKDVPDDNDKVRRVPKALVAALKLFHAATEVDDFIDSVWKALPAERRSRGLNMAGKLGEIAANWELYWSDDMVFARAISNLVYNHFEDKVAAKLFGSNWRTRVRNFNDQYGSSAWFDGADPIGNLSGL